MEDACEGDTRPKKHGASHVHTGFYYVVVCIYWVMTTHVATVFLILKDAKGICIDSMQD